MAALDFFFLVMSDVEEWPAVDVRAFESSSSLAYEVGSWMNERKKQSTDESGRKNKQMRFVRFARVSSSAACVVVVYLFSRSEDARPNKFYVGDGDR